jgi:hypothetical protein
MAFRLRWAFTLIVPARLQWLLHCMRKAFSGYFLVIRGIATLGLRFAVCSAVAAYQLT